MAENRRTQAAEDLARKLKLEIMFKRELDKFFRKVSKIVKKEFVVGDTIISAKRFQPEMEEMLTKHYTRTMKAFRGDIIQSIKSFGLDIETKQTEAEVARPQEERFVEEQPKNRAALIIGTLSKFIVGAFRKANDTLAEQIPAVSPAPGVTVPAQPVQAELPRAVVGAEAEKNLLKRTGSHANTLSITETQFPAESQKLIETNTLLITGAITAFSSRRVWTAILDGRVRDSHFIADGQVRSIGEAFQVGGELLMFPGDTSLGASPGNIINCRCSLSLSIL